MRRTTGRTPEQSPRVVRPSQKQTAMLRRIARGRLLLTLTGADDDGEPPKRRYSYEDGTPCDQGAAASLIRHGWVVPCDPGLLADSDPQTYVVARTAA